MVPIFTMPIRMVLFHVFFYKSLFYLEFCIPHVIFAILCFFCFFFFFCICLFFRSCCVCPCLWYLHVFLQSLQLIFDLLLFAFLCFVYFFAS